MNVRNTTEFFPLRWLKWWVSRVSFHGEEVSAASDLPLPTVWISLYYVAFYVVMTGLFALCIYSLMCTLDPYTPDYQDQLKSPGNGGDTPA